MRHIHPHCIDCIDILSKIGLVHPKNLREYILAQFRVFEGPEVYRQTKLLEYISYFHRTGDTESARLLSLGLYLADEKVFGKSSVTFEAKAKRDEVSGVPSG